MIHSRTEWERPGWRVAEHTGSGPVDWTRVRGVTIHYTAASSTPFGGGEFANYLANIQHDYVANRGYSIGYNWAADRNGETWEARGQDFRCAANGTTVSNIERVAVLCVVNGADPASPAMVEAVRSLVAMCCVLAGRDLVVDGHRDIKATACPGRGLYAQVQFGAFYPQPDSPPPTAKHGRHIVIHG